MARIMLIGYLFGTGLHAFRTCEEATEAIRAIEADYAEPVRLSPRLREYFAVDCVLTQLLRVVGL